MRELIGPRSVAILIASSFLLAEGVALADDKAECVAAYDKAQSDRKNSALRSAKAQLLVCSADRCPQVVKSQCADWMDEVDKGIPTVSFAVTDEGGKDLTDVKVSFDGEVIKESLDGKAVAVDPGPHTFHFESGDRKPLDVKLTVREGDKARVIEVSWKGEGGSPKSLPEQPPDGSKPQEGGTKKLSPAFWVLGGVGVVGMGLFATFGGLGLSQKGKDEGKDGCAPKCTDDEVSSIKTKFLVADVSLAVGAASLAAATIVGIVSIVSGPSKPKAASDPKTTFLFVPLQDTRRPERPAPVGGYFGLSTSF